MNSGTIDRTKIRGILINNPSNPTGAVFSRDHLHNIIQFCNKYQLPILADEVYGDITFGKNIFYPMAQVAAQCGQQVPVITTSGLAKQYLLPGTSVFCLVYWLI
jgi:tyrosine aminotransferase